MSNDPDDPLRRALRPVDPGEEFAQRVMSRIANDSARSRRWLPVGFRWLSAALAASVVLGFLIIIHASQVRREQQGLEARKQLIEALRVTGEKLDLAYRIVNDKAHPATVGNPGV
jgi:hypothetical protein